MNLVNFVDFRAQDLAREGIFCCLKLEKVPLETFEFFVKSESKGCF